MPAATALIGSIGVAIAAGSLVIGLLESRRRVYRRKRFIAAMIEGTALYEDVQRRALPRLRLRAGLSNVRMAALDAKLHNSRIDVAARQFLIVELVAAVLASLGLFAIFGPLGALLGVPVGLGFGVYMLKRRGAKRRARVNDQLVDLLQILSGGLQAGQSFLQSISGAAEEIGEPLSVDLLAMLHEVELGISIEEALDHTRLRLMDEDFDMMVDAVLIQRKAGGNLAEVLSNISWTIRERIRIRGEIQSLTGQARMSGWMLGGLPIGVGALLYAISPEYMEPLLFTSMGHMLIGGALTSEAIGIMLIRRLASVEV